MLVGACGEGEIAITEVAGVAATPAAQEHKSRELPGELGPHGLIFIQSFNNSNKN